MPRIQDYYNTQEIANYYNEAVSNSIPMLGETLFPYKKKLGLNLSYIKSGRGVPQVLKHSAFDVKAPLRDRIGFEKIQTEMPYFKEGFLIKEEERQELLKLLDMNSGDKYISTIIANLYNDSKELVDGAELQFERMRMQLLCRGKIDIQAEKEGLEYKFAVPNYKVKADWSTKATDILADIIAIQDHVEERCGTRPTRAICTSKTMKYLVNNDVIKASVLGSKSNTKYVTTAMVKEYLQNELDLTVQVYSKKYTDEDGKTTSLFDDDVFTMLPPHNLGNSWFGTTPEEADLLGSKAANVNIVKTGIALKTIDHADPVNVETIASFIGLPSFEKSNEVEIVQVLTDAEALDNGAEADTIGA